MKFFKKLLSAGKSAPAEPYHPGTVIRNWTNGDAFRLADALTGVFICGATGSGKTSGPGKHLAIGYLAAGFGGVVLCAKPGEREHWCRLAAEAGRKDDLVIFDSSGAFRFNPIAWEAARPGAGGGLSMNVVALLHEIAGALARSSGGAAKGGGDSKFWDEALRLLLTNLVELPILAGLEVSIPLLRSILNSAPQNPAQIADPTWQENSTCAAILRETDAATANGDPGRRADFEECRAYWLNDFAALSDRTRSVIVLTFTILARSFLTSPLRGLFCADTNIHPEDAFDGKIIVVDLPIQGFGVVGRCAGLTWKLCFQAALLRRTNPASGYMRPAFLWADEAQNFVTESDSEFQAVARSSGGCTVLLTQSREILRQVLGNADAVDALLGNLQCKVFCQNGSPHTNQWAATLLGERWLSSISTNVGRSQGDMAQQNGQHSAGVSRSEQRRLYLEPSQFTTLRRGGPGNGFLVDAIVYNGGHLFANGGESLPYRLLTFNQRG